MIEIASCPDKKLTREPGFNRLYSVDISNLWSRINALPQTFHNA
jgi:hypothetical protein